MKAAVPLALALAATLSTPASAAPPKRQPAAAKSGPWTVAYNHPSPGLLRYFRARFARESVTYLPPDPYARGDIATLRSPDRRTVLALLRVDGGRQCGAGNNCTMYLALSRDGGRHYQSLDSISMTRMPIRVLRTTHHGLPDLGSAAQGQDTRNIHVVLAFDGKRYPEGAAGRPGRHPGVRPMVGTEGRAVIPGTEPGGRFVMFPGLASTAAPAGP